MRRPLLFLPLARFHAPYEPVDQISAIQGWLASFGLQQETQPRRSLDFSELNPRKNQTLSQHRIQRDGRPNELGYGGDVFWFNPMCAFLSSIQDLGSSIASYLARVRRRFSNRVSPRSCRIQTYLRGSVALRGRVVALSAVRYFCNSASSLREPSAFAVCSTSLA